MKHRGGGGERDRACPTTQASAQNSQFHSITPDTTPHTHARAHTHIQAHTHGHTHTWKMDKLDKLGSCPYGSRTPGEARSPGRHFRDYGPAQNKLLKPGQVLTRALTVAQALVVWAPKSHLGHHWLHIPQSVVLSTLACIGRQAQACCSTRRTQGLLPRPVAKACCSTHFTAGCAGGWCDGKNTCTAGDRSHNH